MHAFCCVGDFREFKHKPYAYNQRVDAHAHASCLAVLLVDGRESTTRTRMKILSNTFDVDQSVDRTYKYKMK